MITGSVKNKIDAIWDIFYSGGISNPVTVIEQITYLMFIHDLAAFDEGKEKLSRMLGMPYESIFKDKEDLRWNNLIQMTDPEELRDAIIDKLFPLVKGLNANDKSAFARYMKDATFKIESPQKVLTIITAMDELYKLKDEHKSLTKEDLRGDIYEYMLGKLAVSGDLGQFRTPRHIIAMMIKLLKPTLSDNVCDPACGTAGFLVETARYIKENFKEELLKQESLAYFNKEMFTGYDIDRTMLQIAAMNLMQHNIEDPNISYKNGLTVVPDGEMAEENIYSIVLANPPFKGSIEKETIAPDLKAVTNTTKTELLFIAEFLKILKIGGRAAVIVPSGVLFGSSKAHLSIRKELIDNHCLKAVISMPSGVFKPYAGVSTAILIFNKTGHGGTEDVWFYDMQNDGFSLDDKRQSIEENDIPDIIARYENLEGEQERKRTEKSFLVPKDEIVENGYDLSINKYREIEVKEEELPSSDEIMKELLELDKQYHEQLIELKTMLSEMEGE